jgi:hypothetical protein
MCNDSKTNEKYLVVLAIDDIKTKTNENRIVHNWLYAKYRANKLKVVKIISIDHKDKTVGSIIHKSEFHLSAPLTKYEVGKVVTSDSYSDDENLVCTNGIHYYNRMEPAYFCRQRPNDYSDVWIFFNSDGSRNII